MEFTLLVLAGLGGICLHVIMKFRDQVTKTPKANMTTKQRLSRVWNNFDVLGNLTYAIFALILVILFVALRAQLEIIGFPVTALTIIVVGYAADSALKNIMPE
jgi:hypothetical protein